jgi:hypothetical protein
MDFHWEGRYMKLSLDEKNALRRLSGSYIEAFYERSHNPANFEANIECLRKIEKLTGKFLAIIKPYIDKAVDENGKLLRAGFNIFLILHEKHKIWQLNSVLDKARSIFFSKLAMAQKRESFTSEPRIIDLRFNEHDKEKIEAAHSAGFFIKKSYHEKNYIICFADHDELVLHSLDHPQDLHDAKCRFEETMKSMQHQSHRLTY